MAVVIIPDSLARKNFNPGSSSPMLTKDSEVLLSIPVTLMVNKAALISTLLTANDFTLLGHIVFELIEL